MRKIIAFLSTWLVGAAVLGLPAIVSAQAANTMYLTPSSGTYTTDDSFSVTVRVNTSDPVNAVGVRLSYNENLQFVSIDGAGSAFGVDASSTGGGGAVSIDRGSITAVSGDQLIAKINFKAITAGNGSVQTLASSEALSASTHQNVLSGTSGGVYTVKAPASGGSGSTSSGSTGGSSASSGATTPKPTTSTAKSSPAATSIAPKGNATPAPLPGDSTVQLSAPATVETTTDGTKTVTKVEYSLNNKLVNTDTSPPFSYSVDTENLANGTYKLTTKTYYNDGTSDTSTASIVVKNPFGLKQAWLQFKKYIWLIILLLFATAALVYLKMTRGKGGLFGKKNNNKEPQTLGNTGHGAIVVGGPTGSTEGPMIRPTPTGTNEPKTSIEPVTSATPRVSPGDNVAAEAPSDKQTPPPATS
jgi:hypothetical protein